MFRDGLRHLLERDHTCEVVGEASDTKATIQVAQELRPAILVLDISMPGGTVVQAIPTILCANPATRIVALTMHDDPAFLRAILAAGAVGFVLKRSAPAILLSAIEAVRRGRMFVDPMLSADDGPAPGCQVRLSPREREVLVLLARGLTYREAGEQLHVGERTVETHRRKISEKLGLRSRAELLRYALELGLVGSTVVRND